MPGVVVEPLSRRMWPGMVLLFVAFPHESEKLLMGGIDEGLNAEEAVLKLKVGELSDVVHTASGAHLILRTG